MPRTWEEVTEDIAALERKDIVKPTGNPLSVEKGKKLQELINAGFDYCKHKRITEPQVGVGSVCLDCGMQWNQNPTHSTEEE